ncbi:hypothetical protein ACWGQ5_41095 [Streptomyces sp. NPDC055722]
MSEYDGHQYVGIDLHRRRSVVVRQTADGMQLSAVRILNDPVALGLQIEKAGIRPFRNDNCSPASSKLVLGLTRGVASNGCDEYGSWPVSCSVVGKV